MVKGEVLTNAYSGDAVSVRFADVIVACELPAVTATAHTRPSKVARSFTPGSIGRSGPILERFPYKERIRRSMSPSLVHQPQETRNQPVPGISRMTTPCSNTR